MLCREGSGVLVIFSAVFTTLCRHLKSIAVALPDLRQHAKRPQLPQKIQPLLGPLYQLCGYTWRSVCPPVCSTYSSSHFCPKNSVRHRQKTLTHKCLSPSLLCCCSNCCHGDHQPSRLMKWTFPQKTVSLSASDRVRQHPVYWWRLFNHVI